MNLLKFPLRMMDVLYCGAARWAHTTLFFCWCSFCCLPFVTCTLHFALCTLHFAAYSAAGSERGRSFGILNFTSGLGFGTGQRPVGLNLRLLMVLVLVLGVLVALVALVALVVLLLVLLVLFGSSRLSTVVTHSVWAMLVSVQLSGYWYAVPSFRCTVTVESYFHTPLPVWYVPVMEMPLPGATVPEAPYVTVVEEVVAVVLAFSFDSCHLE